MMISFPNCVEVSSLKNVIERTKIILSIDKTSKHYRKTIEISFLFFCVILKIYNKYAFALYLNHYTTTINYCPLFSSRCDIKQYYTSRIYNLTIQNKMYVLVPAQKKVLTFVNLLTRIAQLMVRNTLKIPTFTPFVHNFPCNFDRHM